MDNFIRHITINGITVTIVALRSTHRWCCVRECRKLIFPRAEIFAKPLSVFELGEGLRLACEDVVSLCVCERVCLCVLSLCLSICYKFVSVMALYMHTYALSGDSYGCTSCRPTICRHFPQHQTEAPLPHKYTYACDKVVQGGGHMMRRWGVSLFSPPHPPVREVMH